MRLKIAAALSLSLLLAASQSFGAAAPAGYPKDPTVATAIPGVVAAGAKWTAVYSDLNENADGIVGTSDGGVVFAQQQAGQVRKIDPDGKTSLLVKNVDGVGALGIDSRGRILAAMRGTHSNLAILYPEAERKQVADSFEGMPFSYASDVAADKKGGVYFNETRGKPTPRVLYFPPNNGKPISLGRGFDVNGLILSPDEKTLYVTNRHTLVSYDIQPDGSGINGHDFATLAGAANVTGDGICVDADGRIYVSTQTGVQVIGPKGDNLGTIPTPLPPISLAFSGRDKKELFIVGTGVIDASGKMLEGDRPKTIYKLAMVAQGFKGRAK